MTEIDLYRSVVSVLAIVAFAVNVSLVFVIVHHRRQPIVVGVWAVYASVAAATNLNAMYFRLSDRSNDLPWTVGDFTALVPTVGFLFAGVYALRRIGRIVGRSSLDL